MASLLPVLIEKDLADLAGERPDLTDADQAKLRDLGVAEGRKGQERLMMSLGHAYATRLSIAEMRVLIAQNESPEAARYRALQPVVIAETMKSVGEVDLRKNTAAAFCQQTGKLCDRK